MKKLTASVFAGLGIAVIYACGGTGAPGSDLNLNGDKAPSTRESTGSGDPVPNNGELPPGEGCVCPAGKWKCKIGEGSVSLTISSTPKCTVDACTGAFSVSIQGQQITGTFKGGQLCYGGNCYACSPSTTSEDDGGTNFDSGGFDSGPKDSGPKDTGVPDAAGCLATTCETNTGCQTTCSPITGTVACCDLNTLTCTYQSGSVCQ